MQDENGEREDLRRSRRSWAEEREDEDEDDATGLRDGRAAEFETGWVEMERALLRCAW